MSDKYSLLPAFGQARAPVSKADNQNEEGCDERGRFTLQERNMIASALTGYHVKITKAARDPFFNQSLSILFPAHERYEDDNHFLLCKTEREGIPTTYKLSSQYCGVIDRQHNLANVLTLLQQIGNGRRNNPGFRL